MSDVLLDSPNTQLPSAPDRVALIATGFDLGWQLAAAYRRTSDRDRPRPQTQGQAKQQAQIRLKRPAEEQVQLRTQTQEELPETLSAKEITGQRRPSPLIVGLVRRLQTLLNDNAPGSVPSLFDPSKAIFTREQISEIHEQVLSWLASHDRHVTTAYELGVQLSDLAALPAGELANSAIKQRIEKASRALHELDAELGPRITKALGASLDGWSEELGKAVEPVYVSDPTPMSQWRERRNRGDASRRWEKDPRKLDVLAEALPKQGELWHDLIVERARIQLAPLDSEEYEGMAELVMDATLDLAWRTAKRLWPLLTLIVVIVAGLLFIIVQANTGSLLTRIAAALVTVGGGLFSAWRTVSTPVLRALAQVPKPTIELIAAARYMEEIQKPLEEAMEQIGRLPRLTVDMLGPTRR